MKPVTTPFDDIAVHVVKPPGIRFFCTHSPRMHLLRRSILFTKPCVINEFVVIISEGELCCGSSATGIFPLGLCRQNVSPSLRKSASFAFHASQLSTEEISILPTEPAGRRILCDSNPAVIEPGVCIHDRTPLFLCHFVFSQPESLCQCHLDLVFVVHAILFALRAAHREAAGFAPEEFDLQAIVVPFFAGSSADGE